MIASATMFGGMAFTAKVATARLTRPRGGDAADGRGVAAVPARAALSPRRAALQPARTHSPARLLRRARGDVLLHRHPAHQRRRGHAAQLHRADLERPLLDALHRRKIQRASADPAADRAGRRLPRRPRARRARRRPRLRPMGARRRAVRGRIGRRRHRHPRRAPQRKLLVRLRQLLPPRHVRQHAARHRAMGDAEPHRVALDRSRRRSWRWARNC